MNALQSNIASCCVECESNVITCFTCHVNMASINSLCDDLLTLILKDYCSLSTKLICQRVCKRWNQLIVQIFATQSLLIIDASNEGNDDRMDPQFDHFLQHADGELGTCSVIDICKYLHRMSTGWIPSFNKPSPFRTIVSCLLSKYRNLKSICIKTDKSNMAQLFEFITNTINTHYGLLHFSIITSKPLTLHEYEVQMFCMKFPHLKLLQIQTPCLQTKEENMYKLFEMLSKLEVIIFDIEMFENLSQYGFIYGHYFERIPEDVKVIKGTNNVLNRDVIRILNDKKLKKLESIEINSIKDDGFLKDLNGHQWQLNISLMNIKEFSIGITFNMKEPTLELIISQISDFNMLERLELKLPPMMQYGNMFKCTSKDLFNPLMKCKQLKSFTLRNAIIDEPAMASLCLSMQQLIDLQLIDCYFTDDCLHDIKTLKNLTRFELDVFDFRKIPQISDEVVAQFISECSKLRYIDVTNSNASKATLECCSRLANLFPQEKITLVLPGNRPSTNNSSLMPFPPYCNHLQINDRIINMINMSGFKFPQIKTVIAMDPTGNKYLMITPTNLVVRIHNSSYPITY